MRLDDHNTKVLVWKSTMLNLWKLCIAWSLPKMKHTITCNHCGTTISTEDQASWEWYSFYFAFTRSTDFPEIHRLGEWIGRNLNPLCPGCQKDES